LSPIHRLTTARDRPVSFPHSEFPSGAVAKW
jgi:hypothetical protein